MKTNIAIGILSMAAVVASGAPVLAGTKAQMNLVSSVQFPSELPGSENNMDNKGKLLLQDKGTISVSLSGVKAGPGLVLGDGALVSSAVTKLADTSVIAADDYIVIARLGVVLLGNGGDSLDAKVLVPVALKKGKGKSKLNLSPLVALLDVLGAGASRSLAMHGAEVWGPIGSEKACFGDNGGNDGAPCATDSDCSGAYTCSQTCQGGTFTDPCTSDADCDPGVLCAVTCADGPLAGTTCSTDSDCRPTSPCQTAVETCNNVLNGSIEGTNALGITNVAITGAETYCRKGNQIGVGGINIPVPPMP